VRGKTSFLKTERPDFRPAGPLRTNFSLGAAPQTYASKPTHRTLHFCTVNAINLPECRIATSHQYWLQKGTVLFRLQRWIFHVDPAFSESGKNLAEGKTHGMFGRRK